MPVCIACIKLGKISHGAAKWVNGVGPFCEHHFRMRLILTTAEEVPIDRQGNVKEE